MNLYPTLSATPSSIKASQLFLSKIRSSDRELLAKTMQHFRPHSKNYEDSWGYIIQATRYGGFKWFNPQTGELVFFGEKSDKNKTLVVPNFYASPKSLAKILDTVQQFKGVSKTILKNVNQDEVDSYLPYGFRPYKRTEGWHKKARFDDQTFPQVIVALKSLEDIQGKRFRKLRNALNNHQHVKIRQYRSLDKEAVIKLFALKDGSANPTTKTTSHMFHDSHVMYLHANIERYVITDNTKTIVGFIAMSDLSSDITITVASIFAPKMKNLSTACEYEIFLKKLQQGFHLVNLGGSEYIGDYNFKKWTFKAVEELEKTHLVYDSGKIALR